MNRIRMAVHARSARPPRRVTRERARPAVARVTAGSFLVGILATVAAPGLASAATAGSAAVARSAASKPGSRAFFGLGPASATKIDGRAYFAWSADPGSFLHDHVAVVNFGITKVTLHVFVTNAVSTPNGGTGFLPAGQARGGPASWVTIAFPNHSSTITLAPRSKVILPITVVIPKNAPPGDHVGAVVAAYYSVIQSKNHARLHLVQQVADRIITRISGKLVPQLSVLDLRVSHTSPLSPFASGMATLSFTVKNTGNELLGGKVSASVHGLFGSTETHANFLTVPVMLPGGSDGGRVTVTGVYPEFLMTAKVSVDPTVVTGQLDQGLTTYSAQVSFWSVPWILLIIVILLVLLAVGIWLLRRRRRRPPAATPPAPAMAGSVEQ